MKRFLLLSTLATLAVPLLSLAHTGADETGESFFGHHFMMFPGMMNFWGMGVFGGWITQILIWTVLILLAIYLIKKINKK